MVAQIAESVNMSEDNYMGISRIGSIGNRRTDPEKPAQSPSRRFSRKSDLFPYGTRLISLFLF